MKTIKYISCLLLIFTTCLSCSSDDESAGDRLRADVTGKWISSSLTINGVESERDCPYSQITFRQDGSFQEDYMSFSDFYQECRISSGMIGAWGITDDQQAVFLTNSIDTSTAVLIDNKLIRTRTRYNPVTSSIDELVITFVLDEL